MGSQGEDTAELRISDRIVTKENMVVETKEITDSQLKKERVKIKCNRVFDSRISRQAKV